MNSVYTLWSIQTVLPQLLWVALCTENTRKDFSCRTTGQLFIFQRESWRKWPKEKSLDYNMKLLFVRLCHIECRIKLFEVVTQNSLKGKVFATNSKSQQLNTRLCVISPTPALLQTVLSFSIWAVLLNWEPFSNFRHRWNELNWYTRIFLKQESLTISSFISTDAGLLA